MRQLCCRIGVSQLVYTMPFGFSCVRWARIEVQVRHVLFAVVIIQVFEQVFVLCWWMPGRACGSCVVMRIQALEQLESAIASVGLGFDKEIHTMALLMFHSNLCLRQFFGPSPQKHPLTVYRGFQMTTPAICELA